MKYQIRNFFIRLRSWIDGGSWEYPIDLNFEELDYANEEYLDQLKKQKNRKGSQPLMLQRFPPYHGTFDEWLRTDQSTNDK
tara:strand:- start:215 stop:457 length:243 start_codon:yes stop_codon:yes gene_type:complete